MFNWLAQKAQQAAVRQQEKELQLFIQSLKGMTQGELATLLVIATRQRLMFPDFGVQLTAFLDGYEPPGYEAYALRVGNTIRQFQKEGDLAAAGALMIWIHSVRAALSPPLRIYGKQVWQELMRGSTNLPEAWRSLVELGVPLGSQVLLESEYVPVLLDPRRI